jgi:hypothetical protein
VCRGRIQYVATTVEAQRVQRLPQIDNLRAVLVAWIIAGHGLLGYSSIGGWPYDEVQEVVFGRRSELVLAAVVGPSGLFVVGTFFFLAGMFTPRAVSRKGPARFAWDRMLRLGVPFLFFMLLCWPLFMWFAYLAAGHRVSYWWAFTHRQPFLDSGPLWFAEVLLYFSLAYALWIRATPRLDQRRRRPPSLGGVHLIALGVGVAVASFVVRLWFPVQSTQVLDLHLWQWPQLAAMFGLGVVAVRSGWLIRTPDALHRWCRSVVAVTVFALPVLAIGTGLRDLAHDGVPFLGGWHWQSVVLACVEACLVVAGSVWLLGVAQRRLTRGGAFSVACGRSAYAAFVLQGPVLLTLAIVARPVTAPAEVKAFTVGVLGVLISFWLGSLAVRRTPLRRFL